MVLKNTSNWLLFLIIAMTIAFLALQSWSKRPIKLGVMHSQTGDLSHTEQGMVDAVLLAIEEINQQGGLLGRKVVPIIRDGKSDPKVFESVANELVLDEKVDVVFGCWTSSCRKSVLPVFEENNHLLYYPLQYEGVESSKNIVYLGAVPNQQVIPALEWSFNKLGRRIYLIGSDYVYPRTANQIIKDQVKLWRGEIVGERYYVLGSKDFSEAINEIDKLRPDVIFNTINGVSNEYFYQSLRENEITAEEVPSFLFSVSENEIANYNEVKMTGDYVVLSYLQNIDNDINRAFLDRFQSRFGEKRLVGNPMKVAYLGVHLWAKAVQKAKSSNVHKVRQFVGDLSIHSPSGMYHVEKNSQHTWKAMHIAKINEQNRFESVWFSKIPYAPKSYPSSRTVLEWQEYLQSLQKSWGGQWQAQ